MATIKKYNGSSWENAVVRKFGTATEAVENPLYSDGTAITAYTIKGNTVQNGTPTPSNPVEVNGVGVRTENLFNATWESGSIGNAGGNLNDTNAMRTVGFIACEAEKLYSFSPELEVTETWVNYYDNNGGLSRYRITGGTFTTPQGCTRLRFRLSKTGIGVSPVPQPLSMLNVGAPLPYEPYGYKIPISSGGVTTNLYLGSTQTVRAIKKLVLDGTENWTKTENGDKSFFNWYIGTAAIQDIGLCTHFEYGGVTTGSTTIGVLMTSGGSLRIRPDNVSSMTLTEFTTWLSTQYANGTPVTVWYVLATAETAAVNEPLMKISDYTDTLSNATAIPTTEGANSITVDTTVQPSEFTATWTGWHNAEVKEWDGSDWQ